MDQSTTPKRKPGRPRKAKPAAGIQTPTKPPESKSSENPLEATIKAARKAYDPKAGIQSSQGSRASESPKDGQGQANTSQAKDSAMGGPGQATGEAMGTGTGMARGEPTGAATLAPLPLPRTRGRLETPSQYVKSIPDDVVVAWATSYVTTRNSQRLLADLQPGIGRENQRWRSDLVHELERLPLAIETMSQVRSELVMSDLQRRTKLRKIAESEEHGLRGYADHIKAIELDAKLDPESNLGRRTESQSQVFNAPVSLFFMPSTQARAIPQPPESKQAEAIEVQTMVASSSLPTSLPSPLSPVGGTPRT